MENGLTREEIEANVLGAMLVSVQATERVLESEAIDENYFTGQARAVYESIAWCWAWDIPVDSISVIAHLPDESVPASYVHTLAACVPSVANAPYYIGQLVGQGPA